MNKWNNFYVQKMGTDTNGDAYPVCESVGTWGVWCKEIPFKLAEKMKEPAKRSWYDEHGDDEYVASGGLYAEAYTMKVELGCKMTTARDVTRYGIAAVDDVRDKVGRFLSYLRSSGMLNMYSSHTRIGRRYVRLESVSDGATWKTTDDGQEFLVFSVTLKVNDPVTDWTPFE